jgi:hypothetical protein
MAMRMHTELGSTEGITFLPEDYCGSCYGAIENFCCNTCEELKQVFQDAGRSTSLTDSAPQCLRDKNIRAMPGEHGCRISGTLEVSKVGRLPLQSSLALMLLSIVGCRLLMRVL